MTNKHNNNLEFELGNFKGPLALLLELIEKRKLPINEVSLSKIADEFIDRARKQNYSYADYADFIQISATLILIKSRSLLPVEKRDEENEQDPQELQRRLKALQELKRVSKGVKLRAAYILNKSKFQLIKKAEFKYPEELPEKLPRLKDLILNSIPSFEPATKIKRKKSKTLEEVLQDIENKLKEYDKISFGSLKFKDKEEKLLTFLALLELARRGVANVRQDSKDNITIEQDNITHPHYG